MFPFGPERPTSPSHVLDSSLACGCSLRLEVQFRDLGLRLHGRRGAAVLAGVSGNLHAARLTAIMGPSGAGARPSHMCLHVLSRVTQTMQHCRIIEELVIDKRPSQGMRVCELGWGLLPLCAYLGAKANHICAARSPICTSTGHVSTTGARLVPLRLTTIRAQARRRCYAPWRAKCTMAKSLAGSSSMVALTTSTDTSGSVFSSHIFCLSCSSEGAEIVSHCRCQLCVISCNLV